MLKLARGKLVIPYVVNIIPPSGNTGLPMTTQRAVVMMPKRQARGLAVKSANNVLTELPSQVSQQFMQSLLKKIPSKRHTRYLVGIMGSPL